MHALTLYFIMKLGFISAALFWGAFMYLCFLLCQYARIWLNSPSDGDNGWSEFWLRKRKKAIAAAIVMIIAMALPTTKEATIMTVVPAVAQSSIWERIFGTGSTDAMEQIQRLGQ